MRNEQQMYSLILDIARTDERVRAVILDGSRADPHAPRDPFQDFDVMYLVTDVDSFKRTTEWIDVFGERMILQLPDDMGTPHPERLDSYAYLMQFMDGNRIDLTLYPVASLSNLKPDSIRKVLLDKDGIIDINKLSDNTAYLPVPPTEKEFTDCCNEFWWVAPYAAKGLWRGQPVYAKSFLDSVLREELFKMLKWYIGIKTDFAVSPGKYGKYFSKYLEPEMWNLLLRTYSDAGEEHNWQVLFEMGNLFRITATAVAGKFGFDYPIDEDQRVIAFLKHVKALPRNATQIY